MEMMQSRRLAMRDPEALVTGEGRGLAAVSSHSMRLIALDLENSEEPADDEEDEEEDEREEGGEDEGEGQDGEEEVNTSMD